MSTESQPLSDNKTVESSAFKTNCLELMDEVAETGEEIVITKNGKPVARLTPCVKKSSEPLPEMNESMYGKDRGKIRILGDIVSPMPAEWFAIPEEYADADPLVAPIPPDWYTETDGT